jgi:hypothetical protein
MGSTQALPVHTKHKGQWSLFITVGLQSQIYRINNLVSSTKTAKAGKGREGKRGLTGGEGMGKGTYKLRVLRDIISQLQPMGLIYIPIKSMRNTHTHTELMGCRGGKI